MSPALVRQYGMIAALLAAYAALTWFVMTSAPAIDGQEARLLVQPVLALFALTAVVWLMMFLYRNVAVARGIASIEHYRTYRDDAPPEWVERPARTFANLLEVPLLFYVLCILMLQTGAWDGVQVALAWLFVALRAVHAAIYIGINFVPLRLVAYLMSCITLVIMCVRFAGGFM